MTTRTNSNIFSKFSRILLSYGFYVAFVLLIIVYTITGSRFLSLTNLLNILIQASPLLILCTGLTLTILMGGIDVSVGSTAGAAAGVGILLINRGIDPVIAMIIMLLVGLSVGAFNGLIIVKVGLNPLITTLAMLFILKGVSYYFMGIGAQKYPNDRTLAFLANGYLGPIPVTILIFLIFIIIGQLVVSRTIFGRHIMAIGANEEAARLTGIVIGKTKFFAYLICGFTAGFAGLMWASRFGGTNPGLGAGMEFVAVSVVILGGTKLAGGEGSIIPGTLFGALMILMIENGLILSNANIYLFPVVRGGVLFLAILVDSIKAQSKTFSV